MQKEKKILVEKALEKGNGILNLKPAWVARDFLPPGRRLGLKEEEYEVGKRGWISERWLGAGKRRGGAFAEQGTSGAFRRFSHGRG